MWPLLGYGTPNSIRFVHATERYIMLKEEEAFLYLVVITLKLTYDLISI